MSQQFKWEELARVLVLEIKTLSDRGFEAPFEVLLYDSDNYVVCCLEMNSQGAFRSVHDLEVLLRAQFPLTASVTDRTGNVWKRSFDITDL